MKLRGFTPGTQARYLHTITALAKHYHRRPDELTQEQIRNCLLYLIETKKYVKSTFNFNLFAIKFLYQKKLAESGIYCG
jgi:integrase/recombinase XerD